MCDRSALILGFYKLAESIEGPVSEFIIIRISYFLQSKILLFVHHQLL